jgi:purine-cytosine permease-like protein
MSWWKIILFAIVVVLAVYLGFTLVGFLLGFLYSALFYLFAIGVIALGGYVGYKYLTRDKQKEIEGANYISQHELDNAKIIKELEDLKRKIER